MSSPSRAGEWKRVRELLHRINNPLMVVSGKAELIARGSAGETDRSSADVIVAQVDLVNSLIEEMFGLLEELEKNG